MVEIERIQHSYCWSHATCIGDASILRSYVIKILFNATIPLAIMLLSGVFLYAALQNSLDTGDRIAREQEIIGAAFGLTTHVLDAETGERGFAITGQEAFLAPYQQAISSFELAWKDLAGRVSESPEQLSRLNQVYDIFARWNLEAAQPSIERRRSGEITPDIPAFVQGKAMVDEFRAIMQDFVAHANGQLSGMQQQSVQIAQRANMIAVAGMGGAVLVALALWMTLAYRTSNAISAMTMAARQVMKGELSYRAEVSGNDELSLMARAFNQMAAQLEAQVAADQDTRRTLASRVEALVAGRTRELMTMNTLVELLQASQTVKEASLVLAQFLPELFKNQSGALLLRKQQSDALQLSACWGEEQHTPGELFANADCWAMRRGRAHELDSYGKHLVRCAHISTDIANHVCIPLSAQGQTFGILHISSDDVHSEWSARRQFAGTVAEQVSLSLANLALKERLHQQSVRDPLTNLHNRRYLDEALSRELKRAVRENYPVSVIMMDVDHFKSINDRFGHQAGDQVLIELADVLTSLVRGEDLVCRYGGEEFTLVLPRSTMPDAVKKAELILKTVAERSILVSEDTSINITVSLGLASYPLHAKEVDDLLAIADQALYQAKEAGRNRVVCAATSDLLD